MGSLESLKSDLEAARKAAVFSEQVTKEKWKLVWQLEREVETHG